MVIRELFNYVSMGAAHGTRVPHLCVFWLAGGYCYTRYLRALDSCRAPLPVRFPPLMAVISSPLHWREWQLSLAKHLDEFFAQFVVRGIKEGFRIGYDYQSRAHNNQWRICPRPGKVSWL